MEREARNPGKAVPGSGAGPALRDASHRFLRATSLPLALEELTDIPEYCEFQSPAGIVSMIVSRVSDMTLMTLVRALVAGNVDASTQLLAGSPTLARTCFQVGATRKVSNAYYLDEIGRYIYAGDTPLHIAAAAYRADMIERLISLGADVRAGNRRGAEPLHSAAVGSPGSPRWNPVAQAAAIVCLIAAGADPNACDLTGVTPLHRAVRTRCAAAVKALLDNGADARRKNKSGSTPLMLANISTGRGGSGSPEAKAQQHEILLLLEANVGT